jgi:hypothetical protein
MIPFIPFFYTGKIRMAAGASDTEAFSKLPGIKPF